MLDPDYIEHMTDDVQASVDAYSMSLIVLYSSLLQDVDISSPTAMIDASIGAASVAHKVADLLTKHSQVIEAAAVKAVTFALALSSSTDLDIIESKLSWLSERFRSSLHASTSATIAGVKEIVKRNNLVMIKAAKRNYLKTVAETIAAVNSGMKSYEDATRDAVLELADRGVSFVDYKSGVWAQADVAMRRHIRTQVVQAGSRRTLALLEETGCDLVETTSHPRSRPDHRTWQGRIFSLSGTGYPDFRDTTGYGRVDGLCGANCKHHFGPWREGFTHRYSPTPDEDLGLDPDEGYKASQKQREYERGIRKQKRRAAALEAAGKDNIKERLAIGSLQKKQREHLKKYPYLSRDFKREQVYEHGGKRVYPLTSEVQYRKKGYTHRKVGDEGQLIASKAIIDKERRRLERKGGQLLVADEAMMKRLDKERSSGVTYGDTAIIRPDATISDVIEEVRHANQNIAGLNDDKPHSLRGILNEIDAKEYLIANAERYNIPKAELELTRSQLIVYRKALEQWNRRNAWQQ